MASEALAADVAVQGLGDGPGLHCRDEPRRGETGRLIPLHLIAARCTGAGVLQAAHLPWVGQVQKAVVGDAVVCGQRAESLKLRFTEEGVTRLLQGAFASSVDAQYSQLPVGARQVP